MNKQSRFSEEFKIEAIKQIIVRGYRVAGVVARLDVSQHSLHAWIKRYSQMPEVHAAQDSQSDELRRLRADLERVTEERDILKNIAQA